MILVIGMSASEVDVAEHAAVGLRRILVLEEAMQERGVRRIDADFERLQPVALDHALEGEGVRRGATKQSKCGNAGGSPGPI